MTRTRNLSEWWQDHGDWIYIFGFLIMLGCVCATLRENPPERYELRCTVPDVGVQR